MAEIRDVVAYICAHYPRKQELSKARLTQMMYLADWRSAITHGRQITNIPWEFDYYGPDVGEVDEAIASDPNFQTKRVANILGGYNEFVTLRRTKRRMPSLTKRDKKVLDHVIAVTSSLHWNDFVTLVYSTYPAVTQSRMTELNLVSLAEEYSATELQV